MNTFRRNRAAGLQPVRRSLGLTTYRRVFAAVLSFGILASGILVPGTAIALLTPVGDQFQVSAIGVHSSFSPDVAMRPDGSFVVVWTQLAGPDPVYDDIEGRLFRPDGTPDGDPFTIHEHTGGFQGSPTVAVSNSGAFLVAWSGDGEGGKSGIFARTFDAAGAPRARPCLCIW